jgi:acetyltransferase-like isoleucine patch superfamily enzyme
MSSLFQNFNNNNQRVPQGIKKILPKPLKSFLTGLFWYRNDWNDFVAEIIGRIISHRLRLFLYRTLLGLKIGKVSSIHRNCRIYFPKGIEIGSHCVINREVLLDGRTGLVIGSNVSISEGVSIFSLEHDISSPTFTEKGGVVIIENYVFIGARAIILPGVRIGEGGIVAAGAVVTRDVEPFTIVAGIPAKPIGKRQSELTYQLNYRKFLG